jgi:hypothetical protein
VDKEMEKKCKDCKYFADYYSAGPHCSDGPETDASGCPDFEEVE